MFKQKIILEMKGQEGRLYRIECDASSPLTEIHDALFTMDKFVMEQIQKLQEKQDEEKK